MNLKLKSVAKAYEEYFKIFGVPDHIGNQESLNTFISVMHKKLSKFFTEESFPLGVRSADSTAMRLPVVSDFVRSVDKNQLKKPPRRIKTPKGIKQMSDEDIVQITLLDERSVNGGFMKTSMPKKELIARMKLGEFVVTA